MQVSHTSADLASGPHSATQASIQLQLSQMVGLTSYMKGVSGLDHIEDKGRHVRFRPLERAPLRQ